MPEYYLFIVVILVLFAISDLIVGVSNDAVNFLNSAIGSKVAPRHIILIIASIGVFFGAAFSGGMMEVARKGIFNPNYFVFAEVMVIFIAVMLTDVILLDLFNTLGLPTSTTVSLIFELLGASVAVGFIKSIENSESISVVSQYINLENVITIIFSIFLSVILALVFGTLVQYVSRLIFSFNYQDRLKKFGGVWAGIALATMTYFLLIKGIKGATFLPDGFSKTVQQNTLTLLGVSFVFWWALMQVLVSIFQVNVLRLVVLFGTFSLAMAFAGNDLVNFIGVPMAGLEAYKAWVASGAEPTAMGMEVLSKAVKPNVLFLTLAGAVMVVTLWTSRKARTVTDTEVGLGRQDEGIEKFQPNTLSRMMVRFSRFIGVQAQTIVPNSWIEKAEQNFVKPDTDKDNNNHEQPPAFDLVRASVNLTVASALIALGTSYKLPLSTTYVTFIVAMGSSLSDRAWGRDSAVYRVSGVLHVIGGWFATAIIAFTASGLFATLIHQLGGWAVAALMVLAAGLIFNNFRHHKTKEEEKARMEQLLAPVNTIEGYNLARQTAQSVANTLITVQQAYHLALQGLRLESAEQLKETKGAIKALKQKNKEFKIKLLHSIQRIDEEHTEAGRVFLLVYDLEQDITQSVQHIIKTCREHVENLHTPLEPEQTAQLERLQNLLDNYLLLIIDGFKDYNFNTLQQVLVQKQYLFEAIEDLLSEQIKGVQQRKYSTKNSHLYFNILLETKDLIAVAARFMKLYNRLHNAYASKNMAILLTDTTTNPTKPKNTPDA
ncbi:MAG TPA: inorganic phosphate transporter [Chitinophagales bacterium]|nr:inorganic phosphate transporter [Chitinophagales bacterium]HRK27983.1 inorganic phosphate transporter [Chitinophagales bacterium]